MSRWMICLVAVSALSCAKFDTKKNDEPAVDTNPAVDTGAGLDTTVAVDTAVTDTVVPVDGTPPGCLKAPEPTGGMIQIRKGPYLQWPTTDSIVVAMETQVSQTAQVAVWLDGSECLTALVTTEAAPMDMSADQFGLETPPGVQHVAKIEGLAAGTIYQYRVVVEGTQTEVKSFRTAPEKTQDFVVAIVGDNRTHAEPHQAVVDAMSLNSPDLVVNTGDAMAAGGALEDWEGYFAIEDGLLGRVPLMPAYGNHEAILGEAYYRGYWHLGNSYKDKELDYAFAYGNSYWVVLNSNGSMDAERQAWMEGQLEIGGGYDFLFVSFHHPLYSFSKHIPSTTVREQLTPLFQQYGVSMVFNGHNHCYEHFKVDGIHYIVTGGGGAPLYDSDAHIVAGLEEFRLAARTSHHYLLASFSGKTATFTVYDIDVDDIIETFIVTSSQ